MRAVFPPENDGFVFAFGITNAWIRMRAIAQRSN